MLHTKNLYGAAVAAVIALSLAACGGGGGGGSTLPTTGGATNNPPTSPQIGKAAMTILIPAKTASVKGQYVSSSTQSITVSQNGTQIGEADLLPTSSNCTTGAGGSRSCTATFNAPVGANQAFVVTMWDQPGGKGTKLSTGSVVATIQAGNVAQVPITLDGVPVSVAAVLGSGTLSVGTPSSTSVTLVAKDSGGNTIVGPGGYSTPITLAIAGDTHNTLALSETSVGSPGDVVKLAYNGGSNVGSTITPSIGSTAGTPATFAGSGASMAMFQYFDATNNLYMWPYVALSMNGTTPMGAVVAELEETGGFSCCPYGIVTVSPTNGVQKIYVGDTTDIQNPPSPAPSPYPGANVVTVHGMTNNVNTDTFESYDSIASDATGSTIFYGGSTSTTNFAGCTGTTYTGTIGALNLAAGTAKEYILKGYPGSVKVDSSGNVWWIEYPGYCPTNGMRLISGTGSTTYAIGELKAGSSTPIETTFASAGVLDGHYPGGMSISADGTSMFITDYSGNVVTKVATSGTPVATASITLTGSVDPYGIATSSDDGTTLWGSNNDPNYNYFYGWVPKATTSFAQSALQEAVFPVTYSYSYTASYGDGSFWLSGGCEYDAGIERVTVSGSAPQNSFYKDPAYYPEVNSVSAGNGYVWATDYDYYGILALQYGAQSNGTVSYNKMHNMAMMASSYPKAPQVSRPWEQYIKHPALRRARK